MNPKDIGAALTKARKTKEAPFKLLRSGSTLLDLASSGSIDGAFATGTYVFLVGDSRSGKTFLSLTCLAEASLNPAFDKYRFIHDDVEGGALMDIEKFFGKRVAERLTPPQTNAEGEPVYSDTVEEFYYNLHDALTEGPCIYVLDSMDGLSSDAEGKKFDEHKKAAREGGDTKGDYGDGKAKVNSRMLRKCLKALKKTDSILIIINQTRDNVGGGMFEPKKIRSGGHALTFYATTELWSSVGTDIKKTVRGKDRVIGVNCRLVIKKNRVSGRKRDITIPIYYSFGIDDLGSCVDYLVEEKRWEKKKGSANITVPEGDLGKEIKGTREKLITLIEQEGLTNRLKEIVQEVWLDIESACAVVREPRY